MAQSGKLFLYDTTTLAQVHAVEQDGLDVFFPPPIGWTEVLDCRIAPYDGRPIEVNCEYATHVRKSYILVTEAQVTASTPPKDASPD